LKCGVIANNTTTTIEWLSILDNPGKPAPELAEKLTQYSTLIVLEFLTSTPCLPPSLCLQRESGDTAERHMKNPRARLHFLYTCLILDPDDTIGPWLIAGPFSLMPLNNMTTSWPVAATQTRTRVTQPYV